MRRFLEGQILYTVSHASWIACGDEMTSLSCGTVRYVSQSRRFDKRRNAATGYPGQAGAFGHRAWRRDSPIPEFGEDRASRPGIPQFGNPIFWRKQSPLMPTTAFAPPRQTRVSFANTVGSKLQSFPKTDVNGVMVLHLASWVLGELEDRGVQRPGRLLDWETT